MNLGMSRPRAKAIMMESELALVINQQMANERERERGRHNKQEVNLIFGLAGRGPRFEVMGKQANGHFGARPASRVEVFESVVGNEV